MQTLRRNPRPVPSTASGRWPALGSALVAALVGFGCRDDGGPSARLCAEILAIQVPGAEVVETQPGAQGATLAYRTPDEDAVHRLECAISEPMPGHLRAESLRMDGRELSEAELVLVNSELLLIEIRRADPGPPRGQRWTAWVDAVLARL